MQNQTIKEVYLVVENDGFNNKQIIGVCHSYANALKYSGFYRKIEGPYPMLDNNDVIPMGPITPPYYPNPNSYIPFQPKPFGPPQSPFQPKPFGPPQSPFSPHGPHGPHGPTTLNNNSQQQWQLSGDSPVVLYTPSAPPFEQFNIPKK